MKLIIVRHGETEENINKIVQGHMPGKLTEEGKSQASKVGLALKDEKIDAIFSSDLKRTKDTCKEIAKYHKVPVHYTKRLRERNMGIYTGKPGTEVHDLYEEGMKITGTDSFTFKPEGGESALEVRERVEKFFKNLYKRYKNKTVIIVTHGGIIRTVMHLYKNLSLEEARDMQPENASILRIEINDKNLKTYKSK